MTQMSKTTVAWYLLAPMMIIIVGVAGYPLIKTVYFSFTAAHLVSPDTSDQWVGLTNFLKALGNAKFRSSIGNTVYFVVFSVSAEILLGVLVALLLNQEFHGRTLLRALVILPLALPTVVNAMMWRLIYGPDFGALNALLTQVGLLAEYRSWLGDPSSALTMVALADIWKNFPLVALITLAALQTISRDHLEAALLDGANAWQRFWHVVFPAIVAPVSVALVLRTIEAFKVFDIIYVMTRGGPASSTKTVSFHVYQEAFAYMRVGSGASYALIVVLISAALIAVYLKLLQRQGETA
ncbi:carbohydrate ABC transporter permease [Aestuariispira insulae]|uniref:Multiple sugar transport system permease protein n=1 Tax=Aestuariispira insulae TaxID=1461337 RepID=A0A3D9H9E0_9PROT|nr:sugar ABC transporter permease [Aestuariispira insulae]RED46104.1 multiple sugar transport system permease protein [Aestuariispira insulae]